MANRIEESFSKVTCCGLSAGSVTCEAPSQCGIIGWLIHDFGPCHRQTPSIRRECQFVLIECQNIKKKKIASMSRQNGQAVSKRRTPKRVEYQMKFKQREWHPLKVIQIINMPWDSSVGARAPCSPSAFQ